MEFILPTRYLPTMILSPRGHFTFFEEYGYIEPGEGAGIIVEANPNGQVLRLDAAEWREGRRRWPHWQVFKLAETTVHEAGHAIAGAAFGRVVDRVSVFPVVDAGGVSFGRVTFADHTPSGDLELEVLSQSAISLSGGAADRQSGRGHLPGGERDRMELEEALKLLFPRRARLRRGLMASAEELANSLVDAAWPAVKILSRRLHRDLEAGHEEVMDSMALLSERRCKRIRRLTNATGLVDAGNPTTGS